MLTIIDNKPKSLSEKPTNSVAPLLHCIIQMVNITLLLELLKYWHYHLATNRPFPFFHQTSFSLCCMPNKFFGTFVQTIRPKIFDIIVSGSLHFLGLMHNNWSHRYEQNWCDMTTFLHFSISLSFHMNDTTKCAFIFIFKYFIN